MIQAFHGGMLDGDNIKTGKSYSLNSGVALYFSNSIVHSSCERGGMTPVIGLHSVILNPDSVNRVTPPTTMMPSTKTEENISHLPTAGGGRIGKFDDGSFSSWLEIGRVEWSNRRCKDGRQKCVNLAGLLGNLVNAVCCRRVENFPRLFHAFLPVCRQPGPNRPNTALRPPHSIAGADTESWKFRSLTSKIRTPSRNLANTMFPLTKRVFPTLYASRTFSCTGPTRNNPIPSPSPPAADLTDGEKTIHQKLTEKFNPSELQVQDVSGVYVTSKDPCPCHIMFP